MVQGTTKVFSISGWDEDAKCIPSTWLAYAILLTCLGLVTYCWAFLNLDTREAYFKLFSLLFELLGNVARQPVRWAYLHHEGIRAVTVDMCKKQAGGRHMLCLCGAHAKRVQAWEITCIPLIPLATGRNTYSMCWSSAKYMFSATFTSGFRTTHYARVFIRCGSSMTFRSSESICRA